VLVMPATSTDAATQPSDVQEDKSTQSKEALKSDSPEVCTGCDRPILDLAGHCFCSD